MVGPLSKNLLLVPSTGITSAALVSVTTLSNTTVMKITFKRGVFMGVRQNYG
jgi:hypothetical protein